MPSAVPGPASDPTPLDRFLAEIPKVELHVHLEGSMRPSTLLALARKHGVDLPANDIEGLRRWFRFRDFDHFVSVYLTVSDVLRDPEDFHQLALDVMERQARERVLYSEVHFTISTHVARGLAGDALLDALDAACREGRERFGTAMALIPDIVRNVPVDRADVTLDWALAGRERGTVVALGLSGTEATHPNEPFREHFERAEREGLHRVAHAGEHGGPDSIRSALEVARAERIGHGVRAAEDPTLIRELAERQMPLEVCPTSNLCLGVFPDLAHHSFDKLYRAGIPVSIHSDDPPFFNTTLTREYQEIARTFGYSAEQMAGLALTALRRSFLAAETRAELEARFRRRFRELGERYLERPVEPV